MNNILNLYPMIHQDKLIYKYKNTIRIGTDDNDVVEIATASNDIFELLKSMNGTKTVYQLLNDYKFITFNDLGNLVVKLIKQNVLTILKEPLKLNSKYKSDIVYYYSEGLDSKEILDRLRETKITIFGVGGGGSLLALQLANLGVKNLHLVDKDKIEISNLNRQFLFKNSDIGRYKVEVVKNYLLDRNSDLNISTSIKNIQSVSDALKELKNTNWTFCCIDEPPYISQRIINRAAYIKNIPSLYGFSARDSGKMVVVDPNNTGCIDCLLTDRDNEDYEYLIRAFQNSDFTPSTPIVVSNMMLEASWICKKWLDVFVGKKQIKNILYRFDFNTFKEEEFITYRKHESCPTCGHKRNDSKLWKIIPIK